MSDESQAVQIGRFRANMREAGIEEIVDETLRLFAADLRPRLELLAEALEQGDAAATEMQAHAMKSGALNVWAKPLAKLLDEVETAAASGELSTARGLLESVTAECARAVAQIHEEVGTGS